jgi:tetratricopeptide (TPR) repeat protein
MKNSLLILCMPFFLLAQTKDASNYWELSEQYNHKGDRESSINVLLESVSNFENKEVESIFELASSYNNLGVRYQTYGQWDESAFSYLKAIEIIQNTENHNLLKSRVYLNLGLLYVKTKSNSADYYLTIAEDIAIKENYLPVLFVLYKVTNRFFQGVEFAKRINNNQYLSNYYYQIARVSSLDAKLYFDSARIVMPKLPESKLQNFQYHAFIVDYFLGNNQLDSALYHCKKAEEVAPLINDDEVNNHYLGCYASTYFRMGDYKTAYKYKVKSDSVKLIYNSPINLEVLGEIDKQRIFFEKEHKIIQLESQKKIRTLIIIVFLILFIVIYYFVKKDERLNSKLEQSNKTKDRLLSIISHDLRGVIVSIIMLVQERKEGNLEKIEKGTKNLLLEFDNLLHWSAENLGRIELHLKTLDLNEIIEGVFDLLETQILHKKITVNKEYAENCIAFADENTSRIVIRNIIHNSIKYSPENSEIKISIVETELQTKISIADMGCGFDFNHESKGLGLGLDLCRELLKRNEGELLISSSEKGSVVSLVLPNS